MNDIEILKRKHRVRLISLSIRSIFHRSPAGQEVERYTKLLQDGVPLIQILQEMRDGIGEDAVDAADQYSSAAAKENSFVIGDLLSLPDEEFIDAIYQRVLGRRVDPDEKIYYHNQLANGGARLQTALDLVTSPEGQSYKLIGTTAANAPINEIDGNLSFVAKVFVRRFHSLVGVN